jgi:FkbM family methyltransferase
MGFKSSVQQAIARRGYELRKFPTKPFNPVPVFDMAVELLMARQGPEVTFIQVGANDGFHGDPLHRYVTAKPWRGILIEPQKHMFDRLLETYRAQADRLIFENLAISPDRTSLDLFRPPGGMADDQGAASGVSAIPKVMGQQLRVDTGKLERISVPATTLDALVAKHGVTRLDLLQIDVEGYDWQVLSTLDLTHTRPSIIQLEHGHLSHEDCDKVAEHLTGQGYQVYWGGYQADTLALEGRFIGG